MKKIFTKSILALLLVFSFSCEDLNEDINSNPNDILITDVEDKLFLTGAQLANIQLQLGCLLYTSPSPRDGLLSRMPSSA